MQEQEPVDVESRPAEKFFYYFFYCTVGWSNCMWATRNTIGVLE